MHLRAILQNNYPELMERSMPGKIKIKVKSGKLFQIKKGLRDFCN